MKTILSIFHNDIKSIFSSFFVIVIVLAICALPALYAWINIYAAWDPYVNTGNVKVALASRDTGTNLKNGTHVNRADDVIAEVKNDDKICYVPLDDPDAALEGVKSGEYYAAIVFEDGFSYDMENFEDAIEDKEAKITFYPNIKKNGIAAKMTTSAANSLLEKVNEDYLEAMLLHFFGDTKELADSLDSEDAVDDMIVQLTEARSALQDFNQSIDLYLSSSGDITGALQSVQSHLDSSRSQSKSDVAEAKKVYNQAKRDLNKVNKVIREKTTELDKTLDALEEIIEALKKPIDEKERQRLIEKAEELLDDTLVILQDLRSLIPGDGKTPAARLAASTLDLMIDEVETIKEDIRKPSRIDTVLEEIKEIQETNEEELLPALKLIVSNLESALKLMKPLLSSASGVLDEIDPVLNAAGKTLSGLDVSLIRLRAMMGSLEDDLDEVLGKLQEADAEDRAAILIDFLGGDPQQYSSYFTSPVEVSTTEFYPVKFYGMAMAPFFTIIAIWVGGVMLATILKTNTNRRKFPQATEAQSFLGRFMIFFLLGQIQVAIIVAGDISLLHVTPVHPWLMWMAAAVAGFVFNLLIYSMVLSFGNIGRAAVIVIMVLQIAGSSGTYPIEILPSIFGKIYRFFPFPYGINAMREAIFGLYRSDYLIYLGQLLLFAVLALAIGLLIRRPFVGVDRYMNEKLEETEVL